MPAARNIYGTAQRNGSRNGNRNSSRKVNAIGLELTAHAVRSLAHSKNARLKQLVAGLTRHLHDFVRETHLTPEEWMAGIEFLTATGQKCDAKRQEFILLSDVLGVSMLVDAVNHHKLKGATESTVMGPFWVQGAKFLPAGANISKSKGGLPTIVSGRVTSAAGKPLKGAVLDIWQTGPNGLYDVQDPKAPDMNMRGRFRTDAAGRFEFRTVRPSFYSIPTDGPVGGLMRNLSRHSFRPAHIHFRVSAPGHVPLTTHLFVRGDKHLKSDAVFAVKDSLVVDFERHSNGSEGARYRIKGPYCTMRYDFGLQPLR